MGLLKIIYNNGTKERIRTRTLASAEEVIRRRNAPNILQATFNGQKMDLEKFKAIYGTPKRFLETYRGQPVDSIRTILDRYKKKAKS